jgi:hypothetical protein
MDELEFSFRLNEILEHHGSELSEASEELTEKVMDLLIDETWMGHPDRELLLIPSFAIKECPDAGIFVATYSFDVYKSKFRSKLLDVTALAYKKLDRNFGSLFLRPESFGDKLTELIRPVKNDFPEYPVFSSKYYFLSDSEYNAKLFATDKRLKLIGRMDEITISVKGNNLLALFPRPLNEKDFASLLEFIKEI